MPERTILLTQEHALKIELKDLIQRQALLQLEMQRLEHLKFEKVKKLNAICNSCRTNHGGEVGAHGTASTCPAHR